MRMDDGYDWPTYHEVYGRSQSASLHPVPIRCGLLANSDDPDDCVMAIGINDDDPVTITPADAENLRELLAGVASEYTTTARRASAKRMDAAQRLLGDAAVVLDEERWQGILTALSSDDRRQRDRVIRDLTSWLPGISPER